MRDLAPKLDPWKPGCEYPTRRSRRRLPGPTSLPVLAAAVPVAAPKSGLLDSAWMLFWIVAALLLLFVAVVAVLALLRAIRRRRPARPSAGKAPPVDPWSEAGRRARPYADYRERDD